MQFITVKEHVNCPFFKGFKSTAECKKKIEI